MRTGHRGLALLTVAALAVGACSSGTSTTNPPGSASAQSATPGASAGGSGCTGPVITLTLLRAQNNPPDADVLADWAASHPCIKININEVPFGNLFQKTSILAASNNPPDVYEIDGPDISTFAASGILLPLDKYISDTLKADIVPATLQEHSYGGHIYSPGLEQSALGLFYNKDMTDKLGITPPQTLPGWTWAEAVAAMQKCQQGPPGNATVWGFAPSQFGNGTPGYYYVSGPFLRSMGDPKAAPDSSAYKTFFQIAPDSSTVDGYVNSPESVQGAQFFQDLFNKYGVMPKAGIPNAFLDGKACFDLQTSGFVGALTKGAKFKWGVTPIPYFKTPITHTGSVTFAVGAKTQHADEAAAFVLFVGSTPEMLKHATETGALPALKSVADQMPTLQTNPLKIFNDTLQQEGYPRPPSPWFLQFDTAMTTALHDIALGADPKSRLDQAALQIDQALKLKP